MKMVLLISILGAAAGLHTNAAAQKLAPLCPNGVKVFADTSQIHATYQQVGWLTTRGTRGAEGYTDERAIVAMQRKRAAQLGANGIVVGGFQSPTVARRFVDATVPERGAVLAIYIPADSSRVKAACDRTDKR